MSLTIPKESVIEYLIDIKGYDEEEARQLYNDHGGNILDMFLYKEINSLCDYVGRNDLKIISL